MQQYAPPSQTGFQASANAAIAGAGARLGGALLDFLFHLLGVILGVLCIAAIAAVTEGSDAGAIAGLLLAVAFGLVPVIINAVLITKTGQTVGKKLVGTRIVMEGTGQLPGFVQGWLVRYFVFGLISQFVPFLALIDAFFVFTERAKTLHDRLAGTIVVNA